MALVQCKPTSPGRRFVVKVVNKDVSKERPYKKLTKQLHRKKGRNHHGRITVRHKGGGHKRLYRTIDFKRRKDNIPAVVERLEYDPTNRKNGRDGSR